MPNRRRSRGRNPWATHPLLTKGGAHETSVSGERSRSRQDLLDEADDYMRERAESADTGSGHKKREPSAPFSFLSAVPVQLVM